MEPIALMIVDDHEIVRDGLIAMLEDETDITIVCEASNGEEALQKLENNDPDLILMDVDMPRMDGIEATKEIKLNYGHIKILALSMIHENQRIQEMVKAGASGYVFKNSGLEELVDAIKRVYRGKHYFNDEAMGVIMEDIFKRRKEPSQEAESPSTDLTQREIEILRLICREMTNKEIADKLNISVRTVDAHRRNLLRKTDSRNTAGLVRFAMEHELIG